MSGTLLLTGVRPLGGPARDLLVAGGRITRVGERLEAPEGATVVDGRGHLAVPGLVDAHAHLDKTLWGLPWRPHTAGDGLAALIDNEHRGRAELRRQGVTVAQRAAGLLAAYVAAGTSHIRSHVDVDTVAGLDSLHGVMEARDAFADRVDVELVAFPQSGLLVRPGTAELLEAAVRAGADLVGGLDPAGFDQRPVEHLDAVFAIAGRHGCGVDIHLHDGGELGAFTIDLIVERTRALGLAGKVTISHAFALAEVPEPRLGRLVEGLADQRVSLTTVAPGNRPPLPLARLAAAGVAVGLGCDGIRDLWSPWGDGDLLGRAALLAWRAGARRDQDLAAALELATAGGAGVLGLDGHGLEPGCWADLALVPAATVGEAVVAHPPRSLVLKRGRVVARPDPVCQAGAHRPAPLAMLVGGRGRPGRGRGGGGQPWGLTHRRTRVPVGAWAPGAGPERQTRPGSAAAPAASASQAASTSASRPAPVEQLAGGLLRLAEDLGDQRHPEPPGALGVDGHGQLDRRPRRPGRPAGRRLGQHRPRRRRVVHPQPLHQRQPGLLQPPGRPRHRHPDQRRHHAPHRPAGLPAGPGRRRRLQVDDRGDLRPPA